MKLLRNIVLFSVILTVFSPVRAIAVDAGPLKFEEVSWDFGTIREADGPVSHVFHFVNLSDVTVSISTADAGCSCTKVSFERRPVNPGNAGEVEVVFDPAGQTGQLHRNIVLLSGNDSYRLTIEGVVAPREKDVDQAFPYALVKGLQVTSLAIRFGFVRQGSALMKSVGVVNTSTEAISLKYGLANADRGISVKAPASLGPGESGLVEVTYSPAPGLLGTLANTLFLYPEGGAGAKGLTLEGYSVQTTDVSPDAPFFRFQPSLLTFSVPRRGKAVRAEAELFNDGKTTLKILRVECPDEVQVNVSPGDEIRSGGRLKMEIALKGSGSVNQDQFRIKVFTNDPSRPVRDIVCKISTK